MFVLLLLACPPTLPECGPNQHITGANECADDPTIEGSEHFPACELLATDDRINVGAGCADGACSEDTYDTMNTAIGEVGVCGDTISGLVFCEWLDGTLHTFFEDDDGDAVPDDGADSSGIFLLDGYDGANEDGLGLGVSMACWVERYGYTDEVEYLTGDDGQRITELWWPELGLFVDDDDLDGVVGRLSLFGI